MKARVVALLLFAAAGLLALTDGAPRTASRIGPEDLRFDGETAFRELDDFLVAAAGPRPSGSEANARGRAHVRARFEALGFDRVESQAFDHPLARRGGFEGEIRRSPWWAGHDEGKDAVAMENLWVELPGSSPEVVLVAAHPDSVPQSPGAEDDGSAVAAVLELARSLRGRPLGRIVRLCLFDGEELGHVGARRYLGSLSSEERERIAAAIAVEMVGWKDGSPVVHTLRARLYPEARLAPPDLVQRFLVAARRGGVDADLGDPWIPLLYPVAVRRAKVPLGGDEGPFAEAGIPAVLFTASSFTRFYPHYHAPTDALDKLSPQALGRSGRALEAAVLELCAAPRPRAESGAYLVLARRVLREGWLRVLAVLAAAALAAAAFERRVRGASRVFAIVSFAGAVAGSVLAFDLLLPVAAAPACLSGALAVRLPRVLRYPLAFAGLLPGLAVAGLFAAMKATYGGGVRFEGPMLPATLAALATLGAFGAAVSGARISR